MTALLGGTALILATLIGIPAGIFTGSSRNAATAIVRVFSLTCVSIPPLVTSFVLLLIAARTGWLPVGGAIARGASIMASVESLIIPALALALPIAAIDAGGPRARLLAHARDLASRAASVAQAGPGHLWGDSRNRPQRIVCGRDRDVVARPRRSHV